VFDRAVLEYTAPASQRPRQEIRDRDASQPKRPPDADPAVLIEPPHTAAPESGWRLAGLGGVLLVLTATGPWLHREAGDLPFQALTIAQGVLTVCAVPLAVRLDPRRALLIVLGFAVVLRLALLLSDPTLSTDAFRYVWDGRVQGAGINPYRYVPAAPELASLRDDSIYPSINRADYAVTIYPPAAQMLFFLLGRIGDDLITFKLGFIAFEAATILVLCDLLRRIGSPVQRVVAYAWHPLSLWEIAGNAHIDGAMVGVMMLGVWLAAVPGRRVAAAAVMALAAMIKPLAVLALPLAWRPWDWRTPAAAVAVVALVYLPYLSVGTGMFSFVGGYLREESIDSGEAFWPVWLLNQLAGPQPWARIAYLAAAAALLGFLALRVSFAADAPLEVRLRRLSWLVFAGLLAMSPGYPWYYLSLVPFVALFGAPPLWAATIGCFLLYDAIPGDAAIAFWIRDAALHVAVILGFALMFWRRRNPA